MKTVKSIIESIGVYLPPKQVTTTQVLEGCVYPLRIPLERLTGIKVRHCAGETEFSIDLAAHAVADCLQRSHAAPEDIDLLICANISRYDGPRAVTYEPTTSITLRQRFGFRQAIALDISNACAGVWTAIYILDALIRAGSIRRGMVVSGEYISYLADTAQKEISAQLDPQLASLTLGDAGLAVILEASPRPEVGFHDIELYTLSKYSRFCVAKPTEREHGGAAMHTDAIKVTATVVPHAATHAQFVLDRNGRPLTDVDHIIPHQTSRLTMEGALDEMKRRFNHDFSGRLVNNLEQRGNTATTSHLLALRDSILQQRIRSGDDILFSISGSGQTTGTALYTCDDLPERLRSNTVGRPGNGHCGATWGETLRVPMCLEAIGTAVPKPGDRAETLPMLTAAARKCLKSSRFSKKQIGLLMFAGVYRTDFITEPAVAALLAGDLKMNDLCDPDAPNKTLALDVFNGAIGFLNACYLVSELARVGCVKQAMIVTAEVENNAGVDPAHLLGLYEMGSAAVLHEAENGETGFQAFAFDYYPQHAEVLRVHGTWNACGRPYLVAARHADWQEVYLDCIELSVAKFLRNENLDRQEIQVLLPPQISPAFVERTARRLHWDAARTVNVAEPGGDLATSSTPVALQAALQQNLAASGDLGLIVNVGAGVQVACALYRF
ncbi:MAG: 3-oxoacyl-[acyl-carrier-protein] synthase III C-terminal domain-containing protein [Pirellulaceae bacterium]